MRGPTDEVLSWQSREPGWVVAGSVLVTAGTELRNPLMKEFGSNDTLFFCQEFPGLNICTIKINICWNLGVETAHRLGVQA